MSGGRSADAKQFHSNGYEYSGRGAGFRHPPVQSGLYGGGMNHVDVHNQGNRNNYQAVSAPMGKINSFQQSPFTAQSMQSLMPKTMLSSTVFMG